MTDQLDLTTDTAAPETPEFKFDVANIEVDADASTDPTRQRIISARMRKPTLEELRVREEMTTTEIVEASATEDSIVANDERGNAKLFDKIASHVKGFRLPGEPSSVTDEWRGAPELLDKIPSSYKAAFVRGLYSKVTAKLIEDEDDGVLLGGDSVIPVELVFGDPDSPMFSVEFSVPEPTETERRDYAEKSVDIRQPKGGRKSRSRIVSNLTASIKFFDTLMQRPGADIIGKLPDGVRATVQGKTFSEMTGLSRVVFLNQIDPMYKRAVVNAAISRFSAKVSD
jgi:hypothetical protein